MLFDAAAGLWLGYSVLAEPEPHDRCLEQDLWFQCVHDLPAGAKNTPQWSDMVDDCQDKAERLSVVEKERVPEECL